MSRIGLYSIIHNTTTRVLNIGLSFILVTMSLGGSLPFLLSKNVFAIPSGTNLYVSDSAGTDTSNNCQSETNPCKTINYAISQASNSNEDTINVAPGSYTEDVNINKAVSLVGTAGAASTTIVATDGNSTTLTFASGISGATVSGFTITHSYTSAELSAWTFNNDGVLFGQTGNNNTLENSTVTLNRNGIYINTTENNKVIDDTITNNRTGINMTGDFTNTTITGNTISDNWTEGLVMYGTNSPGINLSTVSLSGNTFDQNWYEQVLVKGPSHSQNSTFTGTLNLNSNTFTDSPVTYTTSADTAWDEPAFTNQIPDVPGIGGTATKPATSLPTLRIYGTPSATLEYTPKTLRVGANEPYTTIQSAVTDASAGDTIAVDPGTYSGDVNIPVSNLTIAGTGAGVTLDLGSGYGINLDSPPTLTTGFTMNGITVDASQSTTYALKAYKADGITLTNDTFNGGSGNTGGGVDFNTTNNVTLNNVTSTGFHKNGFAYTSQYLATDTSANGVTFNGVTASDDGWAGIAFYTMNGSNTFGNSISDVTFSGSNSLTGDGQGLLVEGDSDAHLGTLTTPRYYITGPSGVPVDIGNTAFSGNIKDIVNYQTNKLQALSATFSGQTGNAMTAVEHQAENSLIIDQRNYGNLGLVNYYTSTVALPAPTNLAPAGGTYTNNNQFNDSWNTVNGAANYEYQVSSSGATDGGALSGPIIWTDSGTYDQNSTPGTVIRHNGPTTDGIYYWQVRAIDSESNFGAWSVVNKVTVDTTPPVVTVTPVVGSLLNGTKTFNITINDANPANPTNNHIWVYLYNSGGTQKSQGANVDLSSGSGSFTVNTTKLDDGNAWLDVGVVHDAAGNASGTSDNYFQNYTIDNTAPTITVKPAPDSIGSVTDSIFSKVSFKLYDEYQVSKFYINGIVHNLTPNQWSDANDIAVGVNGGVLGLNTFVLEDLAGNQATYSFTLDNTAPTVTSASIASNNSNQVWAKVGDTVTLTFTTSENVSTPTVTVDGQNATVMGSGSSWSASYTMQSSDTEGIVPFTIDYIDLAGINGSTVSATTDSSSVTFVKTPPAVPTSALTDANGNSITNGYINTKNFTFTLNDTSSDVTRYQLMYWNNISGSPFNSEDNAWNPTDLSSYSSGPGVYNDQFTQGEGTHYFAFSACDAAGNCSTYSTPFVVTYDNTAPLVSVNSYSTNTNVITPSVTATDNLTMTYAWTASNSNSSTNVTISDATVLEPNFTVTPNVSGTYSFNLTVTDQAGNTTTEVFPFTYTAPVVPSTVLTTPLTTKTTNITPVGQVLGANTTAPSTDNTSTGQVLGTSTTNGSTSNSNKPTNNKATLTLGTTSSGKFLGLGWWWLLILVALAIVIFFVYNAAGTNKSSDQK